MNYGFLADCKFRFAEEDPYTAATITCETETVGYQIWERVNDVFEFLPISALVDKQILCIHGGIGDSIHSLDDLRDIPKPIRILPEISDAHDEHSTVNGQRVGAGGGSDERDGLFPNTTRQDKIVLDALWSDPTDNDCEVWLLLYGVLGVLSAPGWMTAPALP